MSVSPLSQDFQKVQTHFLCWWEPPNKYLSSEWINEKCSQEKLFWWWQEWWANLCMAHGRWYPCGRRQTVPRASRSMGENGGEMREGKAPRSLETEYAQFLHTPQTTLTRLSRCYPPSCPSFGPIALLNTFLKIPANISPFLPFNHFTCASYIQNSLPQRLGSKISPHAKKLGTVRWQSLKSPRKCSICYNVRVWMIKVCNSMLCIIYIYLLRSVSVLII